jgi:LacI family transcriptional regulator
MREVAELAGVAISSVSRVLSGHPDVSSDMKVRVLDAVAQLEYQPDFLAQSLRRGQTLSVGFVLGDISNPLMADIVLGAEAVLRAAGYSLILMNSESNAAMDAAHVRFFQSRRVDAMILSLANERARDTLAALVNVEQPIVLIDRDLPARLRASAVRNDHRAGTRQAVDALIELGHRRIALVTGHLDIWPVRERIAGLKEAMMARGIRDETIVIPGSLSEEHGEAATRDLLARAEPPTAIIAGGNQLLIGALRVIQEAGLELGRDLSLVTCDDVPLSRLYQPQISSISRDTVGLGRTAAELLLRRLGEQPGPPETVLLPTVFTLRESCAPRRG